MGAIGGCPARTCTPRTSRYPQRAHSLDTGFINGCSVLLILYLAQRLSQPVERLCQYAYKIQDLSHFREMPQDFQVWEFDHLARVFNKMMKRLEQRADELRHAWQDAQMANQLKSEFLAEYTR
jgi:nitrate/nitrite-specific signal transduction histidine kinase